MKRLLSLLVLSILASIAAIGTAYASPYPWSYRDANGCDLSAGYQWCPYWKDCIRMGDETCPMVSDYWRSRQTYHRTYQTPKKKMDANGCILTDGERWCESKDRCIKPWEERCTPLPTRGDVDYSFIDGRDVIDCTSTPMGNRNCWYRFSNRCYR